MYIRPYTYTLPHILYIHDLTRTYNLTHTYGLSILRSSDLIYDVDPYGSNSVYLSLYIILWPCTTYMAFHFWNLSTFLGVTPTVSNYHNSTGYVSGDKGAEEKKEDALSAPTAAFSFGALVVTMPAVIVSAGAATSQSSYPLGLPPPSL